MFWRGKCESVHFFQLLLKIVRVIAREEIEGNAEERRLVFRVSHFPLNNSVEEKLLNDVSISRIFICRKYQRFTI